MYLNKMACPFAIFVAVNLIALCSTKPQFPLFTPAGMYYQPAFPQIKMRFGEPSGMGFGEPRDMKYEPRESIEDSAFPAIGFSLGGMDDRLKAAPSGLDRSLDEGIGSMFGMGEGIPLDGSDVKTTIKNETKGNMKITTVDKKGKNFRMVSRVSEMKDNSSGLMSGKEVMQTTMAGGFGGAGGVNGTTGGAMSGAMGGALGGDMVGGLEGLGSIFGSILGGVLGGGEEEKKEKEKKAECSVKKPCPAGKFCDPLTSKCRKQLGEGATCTMKGQCKGKVLLCKWGKCNKAKAGDAGTFCQKNKDCKGDSGCNMRPEISRFYPICSPRLDVGSVCGRVNPMARLFGKSFDDDEENQDPDSNPCKKGLKCASVGNFGTKICVSLDVKLRTEKEEKARIEAKQKQAEAEEAEESGSGEEKEEKEQTDGPAPPPNPPKDGPSLPGETDPEKPADKPSNKKGKKKKDAAKGNAKNAKKDDKKKKENKSN